MKIKKPKLKSHYGSNWGIFLFLLPGLGLYTILMLYPSLMSLLYSVLDWQGGPIENAPFVGLENFRAILDDRHVGGALVNNGRMLGLNWGFQLPMAMLLAYTLSRLRHGANWYRFFFYIPVILPIATIALLWRFMLSGSEYGLLNNILEGIGLEGWIRPWLSGDGIVQWSVTFPDAWVYIGFFMVIFWAALVGIPEEYYEAAAIDGANAWQQLIHITLPNIKSVYVYAMILGLQAALGAFMYPLLMTRGGPLHLSETLVSYSIYLLWEQKIWGYGSAVTVLSFLIGIVATILVLRFGLGRDKEIG
jgi:ABC-type sugar transport system permease subunit